MSETPNVPGRGTPPRTPGWVKVFIVVLIVLIGIVVFAHLMGFRFDHGASGNLLGSLVSSIEPVMQL
jgi:hypothetical protein